MRESWITTQWQKRGLFAYLLLPLSWLYAAVGHLRRLAYQRGFYPSFRAPVPVVIVGNIYVGGTGKTPVILSLIQALRDRGWHPGLVSRGYGSVSKKVPSCGAGNLDAALFGDEPAMISRKTQIPIAVHANRAAACQALLRYAPETNVILSDDGLQHWALERDIELLVQDERGCGNGFVLPAGPLREAAARRKCVDAILTRSSPQSLTQTLPSNGILQCRFTVQTQQFMQFCSGTTLSAQEFHATVQTTTVVAIAGIGVPDRFFNDLRDLGISLDRTIALPDHSPIAPDWIASLPEHTILMTEKDAARLIQHDVASAATQQRPEHSMVASPSTTQAYCPQADPRIWVGIAATCWQDETLFNWLDQRLASMRQSQA